VPTRRPACLFMVITQPRPTVDLAACRACVTYATLIHCRDGDHPKVGSMTARVIRRVGTIGAGPLLGVKRKQRQRSSNPAPWRHRYPAIRRLCALKTARTGSI
jgi:hypothetical protein